MARTGLRPGALATWRTHHEIDIPIRSLYEFKAVIWADRIAIGVAILVAFGFAIAFVSSDAALRLEGVRSHLAKLDAACAQELTATRQQDGNADKDAAPPASDADASSEAQRSAGEVETMNPADDGVKTAPLPARICFDMKVRDELESEEEAITVPTMRGTLLDILKAEVFGVVPLWVGLRIFDFQSGGPQRRLARATYWRATQGVRRAHRRRQREQAEAEE